MLPRLPRRRCVIRSAYRRAKACPSSASIRWAALPHLTRANGITIRQLLTHTSGYQDYYPLDYVADFMKKPATADEILQRWAGKALDFDPGTRWQYSNTNFVAAGRILERVSACRSRYNCASGSAGRWYGLCPKS
ncbi:MAG TPA: serine hydrolase domain-containing protein [Bryobacteraceae bacterium]|nr:serine hydrolase domain-containing protein [Bryobacteraceae bacterium]